MRIHVKLTLMAVLISFSWSWAQPLPGDKTHGEEEQIRQRQQWFVQSRGLDAISAPHLLRKAAVFQTRQMMADTRASRQSWSSLGPSPMTMFSWAMGRVAGRVSALAVNPENIQHMVLGAASGGVWVTQNGGVNWTPVFDDMGTQTVGSLLMDPMDPEIVWVGTGEQGQPCLEYFGMGVFRSADGGMTWEPRNGAGTNTLKLSHVNALAIHPANSSLILAGGPDYCEDGYALDGGLYRSIDAGLNWTKVNSGAVTDLIADHAHAGTFYAAIGLWGQSQSGIYKSTDQGANWTRLVTGLPSASQLYRIRLAQAPNDAQTLYALVYRSNYQTHLFKSTDAGATWTTQHTNACEGQCSYDLCLAVSPNDPNRLLLGSIRHAVSTNGGQSLQYQTSTWGSSQTVHQDTHVLVYHPTDPNHYWAGTDGGLWETNNNGGTFINRNGNLNITQFYDIATHPTDPTIVFGGAQDNSSSGTFNQQVWDVTVVTGDGFMNVVDPLEPQKVYQTSYPYGSLPSILRSNSGGQPGTFSWLPTTGLTAGEPYPWVTPLAITANAAGTETYLFVGSNRVYISGSDGNSYTPLSATALAPSSLSVICPVPHQNTIRVFAGNEAGGIFRCDDALAPSPSWTEITGTYPGAKVTDIAVDHENTDRVFVTRGGFGQHKLYRSENGGGTWTAVGDLLPDVPANAVAIDPLVSTKVYVGTDVGVFVSEDNGSQVVAMMDGFPLGTVVTDLEIHANPHVLVAGTYGRGAWSIPLDAEMEVTAGPDLEACPGDSVQLQTQVSNGPTTPDFSWVILAGPDTNLTQFDDAQAPNPLFTPSQAGVYQLRVMVNGNQQTAQDDLNVDVGSFDLFWAAILTHWRTADHDPGLDRDGNSRLDLRDLVIQLADPICHGSQNQP